MITCVILIWFARIMRMYFGGACLQPSTQILNHNSVSAVLYNKNSESKKIIS